MDTDQLLKALKEQANPADAPAMKAYMKNQFDFLGVKTPARRKTVKALFKADPSLALDWGFINKAWESPYRELQHAALDYLEMQKKLLTPDDLPRLKKLAQTKSWWDTIDFLDRLVGSIIARFPETRETILAWSQNQDFWLRRLAIDHQLLRKEETDTELLEQILINNLGRPEFFINKAIGWALRDYSKTNPDWVRAFIEKHKDRLSKLSIKEGSKYL